MATPGRKPGSPKVPGSGRKRGSLDKEARRVLTDKMAFDVWRTYMRLGPDWLYELAKERPDLFLSQCLSRLLPPPQRPDDADAITVNTQVNVGQSDFESARRIAFALSKATHEQQPEPVEAEHLEPDPLPSLDEVKITMPIQSMPPSDEEREEQAGLESYRGCRAEQGKPKPWE